ncbi:MAG: hypothetical protein AB8H79_15870 [Myxococcota bacterium]
MSSPIPVEAWIRGRFVALPGATVTDGPANVRMVRLPRTPEMARLLRVPDVSVDHLQAALVLTLDGSECAQAVVTAENVDYVEVTALV